MLAGVLQIKLFCDSIMVKQSNQFIKYIFLSSWYRCTHLHNISMARHSSHYRGTQYRGFSMTASYCPKIFRRQTSLVVWSPRQRHMPALLSPQPQVLNRGVRISITSVRCQSAIPITIRSHNLLHRQGFIAKHSLPVRNSLSTGSARSLTCLSIQKQLIKQFVIKLLFSVTSRRN